MFDGLLLVRVMGQCECQCECQCVRVVGKEGQSKEGCCCRWVCMFVWSVHHKREERKRESVCVFVCVCVRICRR